ARIARARRNYLDVYGPVIAERIDLNRTDAWADVSGTTWGLLRTNWGLANTLRVLLGQPKVEFVDYLADPSNFLTWGSPYRDTALSLEPTSHLRARTDVQYQFAPPLFRPYPGSGGQASYAGYR